MTRSWGRRVDRVLTTPVLAPLLRPLQRQVATIFMLHRFTDPALGVVGHDESVIRRCIEFLSGNGFRVRSAMELVRAALRNEDVTRSVAFTVDDGYTDFHTVGGPLFTELGLPVTVFMPTGIVDRQGWCWWDRVKEATSAAADGRYPFDIAGTQVELELGDAQSRGRSAEAVIEALKPFPRAVADETIERLLEEIDVELPVRPPPRLSLMTWDMVREQAERGVEFGPHTVAHAILSRLSDAEASAEIEASWARLREQVPQGAVPLFCYPNGQALDYSTAHFELLDQHGLEAAVTSEPRYVDVSNGTGLQPFAIPRFSLPDRFEEFKSIVLGVERLKTAVRRTVAREVA